MTPAARLSAAIEVLDAVLTGVPVEQALTGWGRASRFAGSGDRHAVRDLVFDALRCRRSYAALGGSLTGRGLILGGVRAGGQDPAVFFTGEGHAPRPVETDEAARPPTKAEAYDLPDWLVPAMESSLGDDLLAISQKMQRRAPVFLRVNRAKTTVAAALRGLDAQGILAKSHPLCETALEVTEGARKVQSSQAFADGLVELQDAASQAVVAALPLFDGMRVLDLCAGGGGKTLAMAGQARVRLWAHDVNAARMRDLPARAERAGASVTLTYTPEGTGPYDLVLADAPCSGSGSWRRDPQGKWALTPQRLGEIMELQASILDKMPGLVAANGYLAYATCSLLEQENSAQIDAFLARNRGWHRVTEKHWTPLQDGDGFFLSVLTRDHQESTQP
ncbi:MAG: RsmB/NOP family class I SAM-dependent RNA methyltransferase [Rhodobacteraceae bacterium]|nr:RsmB/NOP family class I SAM-dependent RNA methyltransferase [Paracoccaceae bacterium]MCF8515339.1 RsmB/NOP family class I SAM-dependent RNA methyltransferase [Paracoccaceae bacterium]MCF8519476.1 RsmB/NOP family class I SAM-dependent RNA methyltransferase [Paracoccaceae bacterium]